MVLLYIVIIFSLLFVLFFIYQLMDIKSFLNSKAAAFSEEIKRDYLPRKSIVKNYYTLILTKKRIKLQSKCFYARFLNEKLYNKIPISIRFLADEIYEKLLSNTTYLNTEIAFDKLKNAGIFNDKPLYKINVESRKDLEKQIKALSVVYKNFDFRTIFFFNESQDTDLLKSFIYENALDLDYKIVLMKDINLNLLFEINKLNLNYKLERDKNVIKDFSFNGVDFNTGQFKWNSMEYCSTDSAIILTKFIKMEENFQNAGKAYFIKFVSEKKRTIRFCITYKLKSEFFNIKKNCEFLEVNYSSFCRGEKFYFSTPIKSFEIKKVDGETFLLMNFVVMTKKVGFFTLMQNLKEINDFSLRKIRDFILENNLKIDNIFKYRLYIKNDGFNKFFNRELKTLIINEKLQDEFSAKIKLSNKIKRVLRESFNIKYEILTNFSSYFEIYSFFINEVLRIKEKPSGIILNPKKEYYNKNFKIVFLDKNGDRRGVFVEQGSELKGLQVGNVFYTNLRMIDLTLIDKNAKLCI